MEMIKQAINEIALSGLQGVTIPNLWQFLMEVKPPLLKDGSDEELKAFLWKGILRCKEIEFYFFDADNTLQGSEKDKFFKKGNPYNKCGGGVLPKHWVSDGDRGICGYCPDHYSRINITDEVKPTNMDFPVAYEKWKDNFFIIASQKLRKRVLFHKDVPMDIAMSDLRFTCLEIVGKSRRSGFLQKDFKEYGMDSRSTFHHVKLLQTQGLITRQRFQTRGPHTAKTSILFLKRFHQTLTSQDSKYSIEFCEVLKNEPGCVLELYKLKEKLKWSVKIFKRLRGSLYKNGNIQYVHNGGVFNYSEGHHEFKFNWSQAILVQLIKDFEEPVDVDIEDDYDDDDCYISKCKYVQPQLVNEVHINQQMYWLVESAKEKGLTVHEFGALSCMPYHMVRSFARQLDRKNCAKVVVVDKCRQRVHTLFSTKYLHESDVVKQISKELSKAEDLAQDASLSIADGDVKTVDADESIQDTSQDASFDSKNDAEKQEKKENENVQLMEDLKLPVKVRKSHSVKSMKRKNIVLEKIKELKIIEGEIPIYKAVSQQEQKQGIKEKVCRKSITRLLNKMVEENLIKKLETVIKNAESNATIIYYCDTSVNIEDEEFKTAVNETKFRLKGIVDRREGKEGKIKSNYVKSTEREVPAPSNMSLLDYVSINNGNEPETDTDDEEYEPVQGTAHQRTQYGYLPRFPRLKTLQMYLWQLVYGTHEDAVKCAEAHVLDNTADAGKLADWKLEKYDWLTELVKLPPNRNGVGYFQTGDALAIMPVIMFTKCIGVCMKSKTLENMLNHPKKRFTPLRDLPPRLKTKLFNSRNVGSYVGHFMDSLILLTYLGLLYMTPERIPTNRTQIVMLVSKEAILVDTTQSERGYSKTTLPSHLKAFPKLSYRFDNLASIGKYWKDVQYICLNTRLGLVRQEKGALNNSKPQRMMMTLRGFQEHFAVEESTNMKAKLYGDGLGAGGFDSTFFGHLSKNWTFPGTKPKILSDPGKDSEYDNVGEPLRAKTLKKFQQVVRPSKAVKASAGGRGKKRNWSFDNKIVAGATSSKKAKQDPKKPEPEKDLKLKKIMAARYRQKLAKVIKSSPKPRNSTHRPVEDDTDLEAKKRMRSFRVHFTPTEDAAILIVRIVADLLNFDRRKVNYWPTARDILHSEIPTTIDKTVESLARRGRYILKNSLTVENMKSCILECRADKKLDTKPINASGDVWKPKFIELYNKVRAKYKTRLEPDEYPFEIPDTMQALRKAFKIDRIFNEPKSIEARKIEDFKEVDILLLEEIIHNSLAGQNTKEYMPSLVFRIFDKYPSSYLEKALYSLKAKCLIAKLRVQVPRRRALPISTMSYTLSLAYEKLFEMPILSNLYPGASSFLQMIRKGSRHSETKETGGSITDDDKSGKDEDKGSGRGQKNDEDAHLSMTDTNETQQPGSIEYARDEALGGHIACLLSLLVNEKMLLHVEIPDNLVECDSEVVEKLKAGDTALSRSPVKEPKRKTQETNVEDLLEKEEDMAMGDSDDGDEEATSAMSQDDLEDDDGRKHSPDSDQRTGKTANRKASESESKLDAKDTHSKPGILKTKKPVGSMAAAADSEFNSGLDNFGNAGKKKGPKSEKEADVTCSSDDETKTSKKVSFSIIGRETSTNEERKPDDQRGKKRSHEASSNEVAVFTRPKINLPFPEDDTKYSGAVNYRMSGFFVSSSFFSNKRLIDKNTDSFTNSKNLKQDFGYLSSATDTGGIEPQLNPVQTTAMEKKRRLPYASRTTLMLHRSASDATQLHARALNSHEDLHLNPLNITCHLYLRPYSDDVDVLISGVSTDLDKSGRGSFGPNSDCTMNRQPVISGGSTFVIDSDHSINDTPGQPVISGHDSFETNKDCSLKDNSGSPVVSGLDSSEKNTVNYSGQPVSSGYKGFETEIDRFMKKPDIMYTEREVDNDLNALSHEDFLSLMKDNFDWNENEILFGKEVFNCMLGNKEFGITEANVTEMYMNYHELRPMSELMIMTVNMKVAYCVGMYTVRYVAPVYVKAWSINSPLSRGSEEEIIDVIAKNQLKVAEINREKKVLQSRERRSLERKNGTAGMNDALKGQDSGNVSQDGGGCAIDGGSEGVVDDNQAGTDKTMTEKESQQVTDKGNSHSELENPCLNQASPSSFQILESSRSNSALHISHARSDGDNQLKLPRKPMATIVKVDPSKLKGARRADEADESKVKGNEDGVKNEVKGEVKGDVTGEVKGQSTSSNVKVGIGFEASDSNDETVDHSVKRHAPFGHLLGPVSEAELGYKRVTCKPWLKLNCDFNMTLFNKFHRAILSYIMMCPGATESVVHKHFESILRPMALRDILLYLELNGCITKHYSRKRRKPSLFDSIEKTIEADFSFDDPYYIPNRDCIFKMADNL